MVALNANSAYANTSSQSSYEGAKIHCRIYSTDLCKNSLTIHWPVDDMTRETIPTLVPILAIRGSSKTQIKNLMDYNH